VIVYDEMYRGQMDGFSDEAEPLGAGHHGEGARQVMGVNQSTCTLG